MWETIHYHFSNAICFDKGTKRQNIKERCTEGGNLSLKPYIFSDEIRSFIVSSVIYIKITLNYDTIHNYNHTVKLIIFWFYIYSVYYSYKLV